MKGKHHRGNRHVARVRDYMCGLKPEGTYWVEVASLTDGETFRGEVISERDHYWEIPGKLVSRIKRENPGRVNEQFELVLAKRVPR